MYASHATSRSTRAVSLGGALLLNAAILGGLVLAAPQVIPGLKPPILETYPVPEIPPPPPIDDVPPPDHRQRAVDDQITRPDPIVETQSTDNQVRTTTEATEHPVTPDVPAGGEDMVNRDPPPQPLPLVAAQVDPRFADALQPPYPPSEIRLQREGRVSVRVLIGADGRVKAVEQVSATSPAFFEATRRQALSRWRFRPATRGGTPEESWKTMSLRFELTGQ